MRVSQVIREMAVQQFARGVEVWLLGSRVRDDVLSGDFHLLVAPSRSPGRVARAASELLAARQWRLGDRRIDVVIDDATGARPIAARARETGRMLL